MRRLLLAVLLAAPLAVQAQTCTPKVPASSLVAPGKLQLAINPTLPPQQYVDEKGELRGLNVELGIELGKRLCIPTEFIRMDFPAMIPALRSGRFDGVDTGMFWTEERSKIMYMIPYAQQAIGAFALESSGLKPGPMESLAGHSAGIEISTYQERKTKELNAELVAKGQKPIDMRTFSTASEATAALRAGQVESVITIAESAKALSKQRGMTLLVVNFGGTDITFDFRDKALAEAAAAAFTAMRADGYYDKLFDTYDMTRLPGPTFAIRGTGP